MSIRRNRGSEPPTVLIALRTSAVGGAERLVVEEFRGLSEEFNVRVTVLSLADQCVPRLRGIPLVDARELLVGRYTLIHTHLFLPGFVARVRRIWDHSFRWIHSVHYHNYEGQSLPRLREWVDRWVFGGADKLIAVSPGVMESLKAFRSRVFLENALPLDAVATRPADTLPPVVGTVAMLRTEKGVSDLVRAAKVLRDRKVDVHIKIAGDGPLRDELSALIRALDLGDRVELCGYVTNLHDFYSGLAVYVQPSVGEPFGLAALEAFRYRRPLVGTAAGHLPVILGDGRFGLLVERRGDVPGALANGIEEALSRRVELAERSEEGRKHWANRLDPIARVREEKKIYRAVLQPRVCFVTPLATQGGGGLQRQVEIQSRALAAAGYQTLLVQRHDPRLRDDALLRRRWRHCEILETPDLLAGGRAGSVVERLRGAMFVVFAFLQLIRVRARFDIVHAQQLYSPTLVGALARQLMGKPLVVRVTASGQLGETREVNRLPFGRLRKWAFRRVDRVVVLTNTMRTEILRLGFSSEQVTVIPNAVELPKEPVTPPPIEGRAIRLLYTGRLSAEKSLETIVEAASHLASEGRAVEVHLVGGPAVGRDVTSALRAQAETLPGAVEVIFHGWVDDVSVEYAAADVFVLPSVSEGMSNSLLEAMAHGMVCLVSDIPENRAVLGEGGAGLLFRQGCVATLASLVSDLIEDQALGGNRMEVLRSGARLRVRAEFSPERVVLDLVSVYDEILVS
jgi:L-malate glycosyltransferase